MLRAFLVGLKLVELKQPKGGDPVSKSLKVLAAASALAFSIGVSGTALAGECAGGSYTHQQEDNMSTVMNGGEQSTPPKRTKS